MRTLLIGCGYVGITLGRKLRSHGHDVYGLRRDAGAEKELRDSGIEPIVCDITDPIQLREISPNFDWVVNLVSSSKGGVEEYRKVYAGGTHNVLEWLEAGEIAGKSNALKKFVYTSSTSVYGQASGEIIDEKSLAEPESETGQILIETENLLLAAFQQHEFPAIILRAAGIYGPGRGHLFRQFIRGEARLSAQPNRLLNMIHVEDLAGAIFAALENGTPGQIYNAVDDEPIAEAEFFGWLSSRLSRPMPPQAQLGEQKKRKRVLTNKRVDNSKLKRELSYAMLYPTFREGYAEAISEEAEAKIT